MKLLTSLILSSVMLPVCADDYVFRVVNEEIAEVFAENTVSVTYGDWSNTGAERDCTEWLPLVADYDFTQSFTQSQECTQDRVREKVTTTTYIASGQQRVKKEVDTGQIAINHDRSAIGTGRKLVKLPSGINGIDFTRMTLTNGSEISSDKVTRMKYMVDNGKESLWGYTISETYILTQQEGVSISQPHTYNLPATTGISMPYSFEAVTKTYSGDTDKARLLITNYGSGGKSARLYDTGSHDYPASWTSISKTGIMSSWANKVVLSGLCYRDKGTLCSARINNGVMKINYDLPAKNTSVYLYK